MTDVLVTPLDRFIRDQQRLRPVERFAERHDAGLLDGPVPGGLGAAHAYRDLIPAVGPGPGEQYGFEVDLDACSGCKACVSACHSLNGLDDDELWRSAGLLHGADVATPVLQTVTTACHHCVDPACLNGCPVDAYDKDPVTGIVAHLDDQCIGCSYCTLMCPYEVPVYNAERGIVRKCDLCADRLAEGEAPACAQACPTEAITVAVVSIADLMAEATGAVLVPTAPSSAITVPSTRYRSSEPLPAALVAGDRFSLQPSHGHSPLAVMLVLTQLSVGASVLSLALGHRVGEGRGWGAAVALGVGLVALGASVLHLGRPQYAWRAVIGLRHSWLSREIVAFGLFAAMATAHAVALAVGAPSGAVEGSGLAAALTGVVAVWCSAKLYAVTRRRWWRLARSGPTFALTAVIGGAALESLVTTAAAAIAGPEELAVALTDVVRPLALLVVVATVVKLALELLVLRHRRDTDPAVEDLNRTARLLSGDLRGLLSLRLLAGLGGGVVLALVAVGLAGASTPTPEAELVVTAAMLALVVLGELSERRLFFLAVSAPRMPGVMR